MSGNILLGGNQIEIRTNTKFNLSLSLKSHGWVQLAPWNIHDGKLFRTETISGQISKIKIWQNNEQTLRLSGENLQTSDKDKLNALACRWFFLDENYSTFAKLADKLDPEVARYVRSGGGKFLRSSTFHEDFIKTVCTINTNWASTKRMVSDLVSKVGNGAFPGPIQILDFGATALRSKGRVGFRADTIIGSLKQMLQAGIIDPIGNGDPSNLTYEYLLALKGIGPYAAAHCRVLLGDYSRLPIDSEVTSFAKIKLGISEDKISQHYDAWGKYRFLGYKLRRVIDRHKEQSIRESDP